MVPVVVGQGRLGVEKPGPEIIYPVLTAGVVRFADVASFLACVRTSLHRGALALRSDDELQPLTPFEVHFEIEGVRTTQVSQVQVVSSRAGIHLMQLLPGSEPARQELVALAERLAPKELVHPVLSAGVVRFTNVASFLSCFHNSLQRGALTLHSDEDLQALVPFEVRFEIEGIRTTNVSQVQVVSTRGDVHLMQMLPGSESARAELGLLAEHLARQHTALTGTSASPASGTGSSPGASAHEAQPLAEAPAPDPGDAVSVAEVADAGSFDVPAPDNAPAVDAAGAELPSAAVGAHFAIQEPPAATALDNSPVAPEQVPVPDSAPVIASPDAAPVPAPTVPQPTAVPATPPAAAMPQAPPPPQPPTLQADTLTLVNLPSMAAARSEIEKTGGVMVTCNGPTPRFGPLEVRWSLAGGLPSVPCQAEVVFAQGSQVALMFNDAAPSMTALQGLEQAVMAALAAAGAMGVFPSMSMPGPQSARTQVGEAHPSTPGTQTPPAGPTVMQLPEHILRNPASPPEVLRVDLTRARDPRQDSTLCLAELLLGLAKLRTTGTLTVHSDKSKLELAFKSGATLLDNEEREALVETAACPQCTISFVPHLPERIPSDKRPRDPRGIVADMARRMVKEYRVGDLEVGLASLMARYPVPAPRVSPAMFNLRLDPKEARFLDLVMDGTRPLSELPRVAGMLRPTMFRCFYILLMYKLVEHLEEARFDPSADQGKLFRAECERLLFANAFDLIGVHWSEHPNLIRERYQKRRQRFVASSPVAKLAPELAHKVLEKLEAANELLSSKEGRRSVRAELGNIDLKAAASILSKHAELASMRNEMTTVRECLEMALELHPVREYLTMMQTLYQTK